MFGEYDNVFTEQTMVKLASDFSRLKGSYYRLGAYHQIPFINRVFATINVF